MDGPTALLYRTVFEAFLAGIFASIAFFFYYSNGFQPSGFIILVIFFVLVFRTIRNLKVIDSFFITLGRMMNSFASYILGDKESVDKMVSLIANSVGKGDSIETVVTKSLDKISKENEMKNI